MGTKSNKVGTRTTNWGKNGNKVGTRTPKWGRMETKWEQSGTQNPKVGQEWEQSGNEVGTKWEQEPQSVLRHDILDQAGGHSFARHFAFLKFHFALICILSMAGLHSMTASQHFHSTFALGSHRPTDPGASLCPMLPQPEAFSDSSDSTVHLILEGLNNAFYWWQKEQRRIQCLITTPPALPFSRRNLHCDSVGLV